MQRASANFERAVAILAAPKAPNPDTLAAMERELPLTPTRDGRWPALVLVPGRREVWQGGRKVGACGRAKLLFRLLHHLATDGISLDRAGLYEAVWGLPYRPPSSDNAIFVALNRLKERLDDDLSIVANDNGGYRLVGDFSIYTWDGTDRAQESAPADPTFVGRQAELGRLVALADAPLITLTGIGGIGKTRLARQWMALSSGASLFVDLSSARGADDLRAALAQGLGAISPSASTEQLGAALAARGSFLLVLDNLETVTAAAAPMIAAWLEAAPALRVRVTSRERLRLSREQVVELGALETDAAIALLTHRARAAGREAPLEAAPLQALAERLEGIPLALELAAARLVSLSAEQILTRLERRFALLTGGSRDAPARHQTLRAAIEGSWESLEPWAQEALIQCAAFRGGFDAEAAEAILDLSDHPEAPWTLDALGLLRERSLLYRGRSGRLAMYETVAEFCALQQPDPRGHRRHAEWYLGQLEPPILAWYAPGATPRQSPDDTLHTLEREAPNLRAIVTRFRDTAPRLAGRAAVLLAHLEGEPDLVPTLRALREALVTDDVAIAARVAHHLADLGEKRGDPTLDPWQDAATLARDAGDVATELLCLQGHARLLLKAGRLDEARAQLQELLQRAEAEGADYNRGTLMGALALLYRTQGQWDVAAQHMETAVAALEGRATRANMHRLLVTLGTLRLRQGRRADAERLLAKGLRTQDPEHPSAALRFFRGLIDYKNGDNQDAAGHFEAARTLFERIGRIEPARHSGTHYARILIDLSRREEALAVIASVLEASDTPVFPRGAAYGVQCCAAMEIEDYDDARERCTEQIRIGQKLQSTVMECRGHRQLAVLALLEGTSPHAHLDDAWPVATQMIPDRALILALRAAATALDGDAETATALIAEARDTLDVSCSPLQRHTVAVYGAATEGRAAVDRMLETIHAPTADGRPSPASRSHDIRMACRVIDRVPPE